MKNSPTKCLGRGHQYKQSYFAFAAGLLGALPCLPAEATGVDLLYGISFLGLVFEIQFEVAANKAVVCAALSCVECLSVLVDAHAHIQEDADVWTEDASKLFSGHLSVGLLHC